MNHINIAMWSGPRNISTAMMRSWENRSDTAVWDEPLYGYYLHHSGSPHPGAAEVIADQGFDSGAITQRCIKPAPDGSRIFYQKHMTHHLLPEVDKRWTRNVHNCFLIRDPAEVIASYSVRRENLTFDDVGIRQQAEIFDCVAENTGAVPIVLDSKDVLSNPQIMLSALCDRLDIPFDQAMLNWPAGERTSDGVWGKYWYDNVWRSTGFAPYAKKEVGLNRVQAEMAKRAEPFYQRLFDLRLVADS